LETGEKFSSKYIPLIWVYPLQTNLSLFLVTCPYPFSLFWKTHFIPITFLFSGIVTSSHVSFFYIWFKYSSISLIHCSSLLASSKLLGSTIDNNAKCCCFVESIILLVSTPTYLFPIICSGGWYFYTCQLGVFGGICFSSSS